MAAWGLVTVVYSIYYHSGVKLKTMLVSWNTQTGISVSLMSQHRAYRHSEFPVKVLPHLVLSVLNQSDSKTNKLDGADSEIPNQSGTAHPRRNVPDGNYAEASCYGPVKMNCAILSRKDIHNNLLLPS